MDITKYIKPSQLNRQKRRDKRLSEELIECRRWGGGDKNKKWREKGMKKKWADAKRKDTLPYRLSMRKNSRPFTSQDDDLEPLIRFLKTNAGRKWNDVYSELNKQLVKRSATGLHVFEQLWDFVQVNTFLDKNGKVCSSPKFRSIWREINQYYSWFYVHPTTGVLVDNHFEYQKRKGRFRTKARWKTRKQMEKIKRKLGIKPPKFKSYRCPNVQTYEQRLQVGKMYDLKTITEFDPSKRFKMRVKLIDVKKGKFGLELRIKMVRSENSIYKKDAEFQLNQNAEYRTKRSLSFSRSQLKKWKIFDAGTFSFHFSKKLKTITWASELI